MFNKKKFILSIKKFLELIFFLKYITLIIILSILIYLIAPKFFDYSEDSTREIKIKTEILNSQGIKLNSYSYILYKIFPTPRIIIKNAQVNLANESISGTIKSLIAPIKFSQLFNYKFLKIEKVLLNNVSFLVDVKYFNKFLEYFKNLDNKIIIRSGKLSFKEKEDKLITIDIVDFDNKKNLNFKGMLLGKKFNIYFLNKNKNKKVKLILDMPTAGSKSTISFFEPGILNEQSGNVRSTILNSSMQFDFKKIKNIRISNSLFMNKLLTTSFDGSILIKPYFNFDLIFDIKNINLAASKINNSFLNIFNSIDINSKLNGKFRIIYKNKKYNYKLINKSDIKVTIQNSDIIFKDSFLEFDGGNVNFSGIISDQKGYKKLNFKLIFNLNNRNLIFKKFNLPNNEADSASTFEAEGVLNISARKINFSNININKNALSEIDIKYIKNTFEKELIEKNMLGIFDKKNIKNFIKEIY